MTEQIKLIAERIKGFREIAGISPETIAQELGIANSLYTNYENGSTDIPVGFLFKFAQRFDIELSVLLSGENPKLHVYCLVRKGEGINVERRKQYKYENLAFNFIHKKAEPFMVTVEPGNGAVPTEFNSHPGQEFNYILEGSIKLFIDTHEIILNEGDSVYFDSSYKHAMKALDKTVKLLAIVL
jgi:transcriptional regulator with XRE-family HTH domain